MYKSRKYDIIDNEREKKRIKKGNLFKMTLLKKYFINLKKLKTKKTQQRRTRIKTPRPRRKRNKNGEG